MPYAVLEKEMERFDEAQQKTVLLFARFLPVAYQRSVRDER